MKKIIFDKNWLYQKYIIEQLSTSKIAKASGVAQQTIYKALKQFQIPIRTPSQAKMGALNPQYGKCGPLSHRYKKPLSNKQREQLSKSMKEQYASGRRIPPMQNKKHSPETRKLIGLKGKGRKKSPETIEKLASKLRGKLRPPYSLEWKNKISISIKQLWTTPEYRNEMLKKQSRGMAMRPTWPEKTLDRITPPEVQYVGDRKKVWYILPNGKYKNPDFIIKNQNKVIEVFGDYWHRNDNPNNLINLYKQIGIDCLVIWESEIKKQLPLIKDKIQDFLIN